MPAELIRQRNVSIDVVLLCDIGRVVVVSQRSKVDLTAKPVYDRSATVTAVNTVFRRQVARWDAGKCRLCSSY